MCGWVGGMRPPAGRGARRAPPDAPPVILHLDQLRLHHVELLQAVGVLGVGYVPDVLEDLQRVDGLPLALIGHLGARLQGGAQQRAAAQPGRGTDWRPGGLWVSGQLGAAHLLGARVLALVDHRVGIDELRRTHRGGRQLHGSTYVQQSAPGLHGIAAQARSGTSRCARERMGDWHRCQVRAGCERSARARWWRGLGALEAAVLSTRKKSLPLVESRANAPRSSVHPTIHHYGAAGTRRAAVSFAAVSFAPATLRRCSGPAPSDAGPARAAHRGREFSSVCVLRDGGGTARPASSSRPLMPPRATTGSSTAPTAASGSSVPIGHHL